MVEPNNDNEFRIPDLIIKKRDGQKLSKDEIDFFVESVVSGHLQESQIGKHVFFYLAVHL
jgi:thymidine phosphorylase